MNTFAGLLMYFSLLNAFGLTPPEGEAYNQAKSVIDQNYREHVMSIYGKGSTESVKTWYITFYDPTSASKAKTVVVINGKIDRVHPSESRTSYDDVMSFDPLRTRISSSKALETARQYAEKNQISHDGVNMLLKRSESGKAPHWRVELLNQGTSRGYVFVEPEKGEFAKYEAPKSVDKKGEHFAKDVEQTFRGIGADLEEFFTGERTVDKD